jgi:hypothetical protein
MEGAYSTKSFPWLNSPGNEFFLLRLPNIKEDDLTNAVSYISNNCFYYRNEEKKYLHLPNVKVVKKHRASIELERLFSEAVCNEDLPTDDCRYQTNPVSKEKLLKSNAIKNIYTLAEKQVQQVCKSFSPSKFSVLYSEPGGNPQGLHIDDYRTKEEKKKFGEMLSAIVSIQDDTSIDVLGHNENSRMSIMIPKGFMFLFSGNLMHGGLAYATHNVRLHLYFLHSSAFADDKIKKQLERNEIALKRVCPVADCPRAKNRILLTSKELQDHWRVKHRNHIGMTYGQYLGSLNGTLKTCQTCGKLLLNERSAKNHAHICNSNETK